MQQQDVYQNLGSYLRSAVGVLELDKNSSLYRDAIAVCDYLEDPMFRIAVFGPFNYGKSTLLNALLGEKALPIDLIPTTGAAIAVKYGSSLHTRITLTSGREISEPGTKVLKQYAILDDDRRMRDDVTAVEVTCPHPFLKTGVEFLDLPGTNDREEQDALVRDRLLTADLIVQVLDGRKLMTLGERENLRDWLSDRGITTVVFVVNFLNLLEPDEQKEVSNRMRFIAESFRSDVPNGVSNLYRVDALPALRARLKGDVTAAQTSGLSTFESALQNIVAHQRETGEIRFPRVRAIATQIIHNLQTHVQALNTKLEAARQKRQNKIQIKKKAEKLISQGFAGSSSDFQSWLYLPKLLNRYQSELATALEQNQFNPWESKQFKPAVQEYEKTIADWVNKACEFFGHEHPGNLEITYPNIPPVTLPPQPPSKNKLNEVWKSAVQTANVLFNEATGKSQPPPSYSDKIIVTKAYEEAAKNYLTRFSELAFSNLYQYEKKVENILAFDETKEPENIPLEQHQFQYLNTLLNNLERELEIVSSRISEN